MRLPEALADDVIGRADDAGLDINDYVTLVMCEVHGHKVPEYIQVKLKSYEAQTQLPLVS